LRKRYDNAVRERDTQVAAFESFSAEQAERVPVWRKMVEEFEEEVFRIKDVNKRQKKNPYQAESKGECRSTLW
jgi:hypothetical protein